jgi:hypothetical protein
VVEDLKKQTLEAWQKPLMIHSQKLEEHNQLGNRREDMIVGRFRNVDSFTCEIKNLLLKTVQMQDCPLSSPIRSAGA